MNIWMWYARNRCCLRCHIYWFYNFHQLLYVNCVCCCFWVWQKLNRKNFEHITFYSLDYLNDYSLIKNFWDTSLIAPPSTFIRLWKDLDTLSIKYPKVSADFSFVSENIFFEVLMYSNWSTVILIHEESLKRKLLESDVAHIAFMKHGGFMQPSYYWNYWVNELIFSQAWYSNNSSTLQNLAGIGTLIFNKVCLSIK